MTTVWWKHSGKQSGLTVRKWLSPSSHNPQYHPTSFYIPALLKTVTERVKQLSSQTPNLLPPRFVPPRAEDRKDLKTSFNHKHKSTSTLSDMLMGPYLDLF
jgi:hypothetical protein